MRDLVASFRLTRTVRALMRQPLVANAGYLIVVEAINAGVGFLFWAVAAHLYSAGAIGTASAVIAAVALLANLASGGIGVGLVHFLPAVERPRRLLNTSFTFVTLTAVIAATIFFFGIPLWAPDLAFLHVRPLYFGGFVAFAAFAALATTLRMALLARRKAAHNVSTALILNVSRVALVVLFVGLGAAGVVAATGVGTALAVLVGVTLLLPRVEANYRLSPRISLQDLKTMLPYSIGNDVANLLAKVPQRILPLLVLALLGSAANGYAHIAWMVGALLVTPALAVTGSAFAEGSNRPASAVPILYQSAAMGLLLTVPTAAAVAVASPLLLSLFGAGYAANATTLLRWLALAAPFVFLAWLYFTHLRLLARLRALIALGLLVTGVTLAGALALLPRVGIAANGISWLAAHLLVTLIAFADLAPSSRVKALSALVPRMLRRRSPSRPDAGTMLPGSAPGTIAPNPSRRPRLGFFRGANFSHSIGVTDWRIGLYMDSFDTWLFGQGPAPPCRPAVHFVSSPTPSLPILGVLLSTWHFARQAAGLQLDVIICNPGLACAGLLCRLLYPPARIILDVRSLPVETHGLRARLNRFYFDAVLRCAPLDALSVISAGMLAGLRSTYPRLSALPTVTWASAYDHRLFRPLDRRHARRRLGLAGKFVLMFHGTLSPSRGLQETIRALHLLPGRHLDDLVLLLLGRGRARPDLEELAGTLRLRDHVRFLPPVPHESVPEYIAAADLGLDPLPDHPWWRHQSALKLFEYLAMGVPVLATDIPCHRDISDAVLLAADNAPETLAAAIARFRELPERDRVRLGAVARAQSAGHTWQARAARLSHFIEEEVLA